MLTTLEILESANTSVCQTTILLQAAIICDHLESAGIPAIFRQTRCPDGGHFQVDVPQAYAADALRLLNGEPARGEIFFITE
jgi:hypothetical protein